MRQRNLNYSFWFFGALIFRKSKIILLQMRSQFYIISHFWLMEDNFVPGFLLSKYLPKACLLGSQALWGLQGLLVIIYMCTYLLEI